VREPGAADLFVAGADVIPRIDGDDWSRVILVEDYLETIRKGVLLELDARSSLRAGVRG
jgi:hypothetical protein